MRLTAFCIALIATLYGTNFARAHEFWISPESYAVTSGDPIIANIRVGQNFKGSAYTFAPAQFVRFDLLSADGITPVEGRLGDMPALTQTATEGLVVVVHETTASILTWSEWEKFTAFVEHKGFDGVFEDHRARGLPETGFGESYTRYAKSLVAVGDGEGQDRIAGLLTEIVALANPYTDDLSGGMPVRVLYEGEPRAEAQVEVFARGADGEVVVTTQRTDAEGLAVIAVTPGTEYLIDAVVMRPLPEGAVGIGPVWDSLWASLTFQVP